MSLVDVVAVVLAVEVGAAAIVAGCVAAVLAVLRRIDAGAEPAWWPSFERDFWAYVGRDRVPPWEHPEDTPRGRRQWRS